MTVTLDHLLTQSATLLRRTYDGPPDDLGDPSWVEVERDVPCLVQQSSSTELIEGQVMRTTYRVFLDASCVDVAGWDALRIDGELYEVEGDPAPQYNPRAGAVVHVEVVATRVR